MSFWGVGKDEYWEMKYCFSRSSVLFTLLSRTLRCWNSLVQSCCTCTVLLLIVLTFANCLWNKPLCGYSINRTTKTLLLCGAPQVFTLSVYCKHTNTRSLFREKQTEQNPQDLLCLHLVKKKIKLKWFNLCINLQQIKKYKLIKKELLVLCVS